MRAIICCLLIGLIGCPDPATGPSAMRAGEPEPAVAPEPEPQPVAVLDDYAPSAAITIRVDDLGMPHIYGETDLDVVFGAGYQQAVDHLWAVDVSRRAAVGRLAEVFGEARYSGDVQARVLDFRGVAAKSAALLQAERPADYNLIVAFVAGLNRRVAEIRAGEATVPPEFTAYGVTPEPFEVIDPLAIGMRIQFGFSSTLEFDLLYSAIDALAPAAAALRVFAPVGDAFIVAAGRPTAGPPRRRVAHPNAATPDPEALRQLSAFIRQYRIDLGVGEGSNGWVIHGDHTFNGRPILANDSHASLADPNVMDLLHMQAADGSFNAMGMAFLGVPGVHVGRNDAVVWGATTNYADMLDLWDVRVSDGMATLGTEHVPVSSRTEAIQVRQDDGSMRTEEIVVQGVPHRGIFIPDAMLPFPKALIVRGELMVAWPGLDGTTDLLAFLDMARAQSVDEFEAAIRLMQTGMQNWMGASAEGWRYLSHGRVPDRGPVADRPPAYRVLDGANPRHLWSGVVLPDHQLPYLDGSQPFMASANNDPWGHTADDDPLNDTFYYGSFFSPAFRALRLKTALPALISAGGTTPADSMRLQMEVDSQLAPRLLPDLLMALEAIPTEPALAEWRDRADLTDAATLLAEWDGRATTGSRAMSLFRIWWGLLARDMLRDDLSLLFDAIDEEQPVFVAKFVLLTLEDGEESLLDEAPEVLMVRALAKALDLLTAEGPIPVWGDLHVARLRRPDDTTRDLVTPGDDTTLNVAQSRCLDGEALLPRCWSRVGAVYRMVTHFDDSGLPITDFNCPACRPDGDQDWIDGVYRRLRFTPAEVEANTVRTVTLAP